MADNLTEPYDVLSLREKWVTKPYDVWSLGEKFVRKY